MKTALLDEFGRGDAAARAESWRYSQFALRALEQNDFAAAVVDAELPAEIVARFDWPQTMRRRAVFVNGEFSARYSSASAAIGHAAQRTDITIDDGETVHAVFVNVASMQATRWRRDVALHVRGSAEWIEQHIGMAGRDVLGALTSSVKLAAGAKLSAVTTCDLPDSASLYRHEQVRIGDNAQYRSTHVLLGGRLQRFDLDVEMNGVGAGYCAQGVFAPRARQHIDVHLEARHAERDTHSDVLWRGVADQRGRGILHGAITVAAGADGADARLQTKNLLLSPHAEIDAQPVLEIHADEVKASHGATVGQLDERALFYLRSRGVPLATARNLLIAGFCREALERVGDAELRARLDAMLAERMPQAGAMG